MKNKENIYVFRNNKVSYIWSQKELNDFLKRNSFGPGTFRNLDFVFTNMKEENNETV